MVHRCEASRQTLPFNKKGVRSRLSYDDLATHRSSWRQGTWALSSFTAVLLATLGSLGVVSARASADTVIGQVAPTPSPPAKCISGPFDELPVGSASGPAYSVPFEGTITSWSTQAAAGAGQQLVFKVFRPEGEGKFKVVAHDGPRALSPSTVNTFAVSIPVKTGDVIGYNDTASASAHPTACFFNTGSSADRNIFQGGEAPDGGIVEAEFGGFEEQIRPNISAVVTPPVVPVVPVVPVAPVAPTPLPPVPTPEAHCLVPRLKGLKLKAAKTRLEKAACKLGHVAKKEGVTTKTGKVVKQKPKAGTVKPEDSKVSVKFG
jgi:hypothetical protein